MAAPEEIPAINPVAATACNEWLSVIKHTDHFIHYRNIRQSFGIKFAPDSSWRGVMLPSPDLTTIWRWRRFNRNDMKYPDYMFLRRVPRCKSKFLRFLPGNEHCHFHSIQHLPDFFSCCPFMDSSVQLIFNCCRIIDPGISSRTCALAIEACLSCPNHLSAHLVPQ